MSFSGKKFRRVRCEDMDKLIESNNHLSAMMRSGAPTFFYTRVDEESFQFSVTMGERVTSFTFKLGQEFEVERLDGAKLKMMYTLDGEDVIIQRITLPDGKTLNLRKELSSEEPKTIVTVDGKNGEARVYYEVVK